MLRIPLLASLINYEDILSVGYLCLFGDMMKRAIHLIFNFNNFWLTGITGASYNILVHIYKSTPVSKWPSLRVLIYSVLIDTIYICIT